MSVYERWLEAWRERMGDLSEPYLSIAQSFSEALGGSSLASHHALEAVVHGAFRHWRGAFARRDFRLVRERNPMRSRGVVLDLAPNRRRAE